MAKLLRFLAWASLILALVIGFLRLTAIRWWRVPTGDPYLEASVAPSLRGGDWIVLWRATAPTLGSLVLCPDPKASDRQVVARIMAEAHDHIRISGANVHVNRGRFESEGACDRFTVVDPASNQALEQSCSGEIVGGRTHWTAQLSEAAAKPSDAEFDVPSGQVFLVSDNRQFPWDSRDFGPVARDTCTETVIFRLLSKDGFFDVTNRFTLIR